ncbi:MAG: four helix bundle protein [Bacteroidales bacterium]|nr:four helix bundle protein [Bacteroidales bacterium]
MEKKNNILELSFEFALDIIEYVERLEEKRKYVIAKQLLKSGTSIGANIRESQSAGSKADFIHKFKIADKEIKETEYWLMLCQASQTYPNPSEKLLKNFENIKNIISKIIITSKNKINFSKFSNLIIFEFSNLKHE